MKIVEYQKPAFYKGMYIYTHDISQPMLVSVNGVLALVRFYYDRLVSIQWLAIISIQWIQIFILNAWLKQAFIKLYGSSKQKEALFV